MQLKLSCILLAKFRVHKIILKVNSVCKTSFGRYMCCHISLLCNHFKNQTSYVFGKLTESLANDRVFQAKKWNMTITLIQQLRRLDGHGYI